MPLVVKDTATVARKFVQRASVAGPDYKSGVETTPKDWAGNTAAAEGSYEEGVQAAIARKAYGKNVRAAGSEKWKSKAASLGAARYPQGVSGAEAAYSSGVGPYLDTLRAVDAGPRAARGSPQNIERVRRVCDALHKKKVGG